MLHVIAVATVCALAHASPEADRILISSLPAHELRPYRTYKDVTVLRHSVPTEVRSATWTFIASERLLSRCNPRPVTVVLKYGSCPVISPDGSSFPDNFHANWEAPHTLQFRSDSVIATLDIDNPLPGDWFAVAFVSYTAPEDEGILQEGISATCVAVLTSALEITRNPTPISNLPPGVPTRQTLERDFARKPTGEVAKTYRFYVASDSWLVIASLTMTVCGRGKCPDLLMVASGRNLPGTDVTNHRVVCSSPQVGAPGCLLVVMAVQDSWHYLTISSEHNITGHVAFQLIVSVTNSSYSIASSKGSRHIEHILSNLESKYMSLWNRYYLTILWREVHFIRQSFQSFFEFNYVLGVSFEDNANAISVLNISATKPTSIQIHIHTIIDIGGTLTFHLGLSNPAEPGLSVVACISHGVRSTPTFPNICIDPFDTPSAAQIQVNSSSAAGQAHIPYPEYGSWYLTLRPYCFSDSTPGAPPQIKECPSLTRVSVILGIESYPCFDHCGPFGTCKIFQSGGIVLPTCVCSHGFTGWGCTDDRHGTSREELLLAVLLLTLSNLFFIPAVVFAIRRGFYTEALVYAFTMIFSTFYHACESGTETYQYCMFELHVLQFCDFYSATLSFWVTLIAMSGMSSQFKSSLQMAGAICIALGTESNKTGLLPILVPCVVGTTILTAMWGSHCRRRRGFYPSTRYWILSMAPGMVLVVVGLVCYVFLQTNRNYKFVHSVWHACIALSITFLLPARRHLTADDVSCQGPHLTTIRVFCQRFFCNK